jgi:phospholipid/cholesterol/gamma-HCH transport system ATP-binding protein
MIEVKNLYKSFQHKEVLKDISIKFEEGKVNFIIGRSGSGKSVLTKCIVGLIDPDKGDVAYDGTSFTRMDRIEKQEVRKKIGMLFQGSALFDSMSVIENVMFPLNMFTELSDGERIDR